MSPRTREGSVEAYWELELSSQPAVTRCSYPWCQEIIPFADDMIIYVGDPKDSIKILLEFKSRFRKVTEYKINTENSIALLHISNDYMDTEI